MNKPRLVTIDGKSVPNRYSDELKAKIEDGANPRYVQISMIRGKDGEVEATIDEYKMKQRSESFGFDAIEKSVGKTIHSAYIEDDMITIIFYDLSSLKIMDEGSVGLGGSYQRYMSPKDDINEMVGEKFLDLDHYKSETREVRDVMVDGELLEYALVDSRTLKILTSESCYEIISYNVYDGMYSGISYQIILYEEKTDE